MSAPNVISEVLTKMAKMFITLKIMPESPETDLNSIRKKVETIAEKFEAQLLDKDEIEPVAFGLKALKLIFMLDESKGSEELAEAVAELEEVSSTDVIDMRRALG